MRARSTSAKKPTNVSIDRELLETARAHGINLSATLEEALRNRIRMLRASQWLAENRAAIDLYNDSVLREGTFSDGLRSF